MALYGNDNAVHRSNKPERYSVLHPVSTEPPAAGIYECQSCGFEDVINRDCDRLPPCSNCRTRGHNWKLLVRALDSNEKDAQPYR